MNDSIFQPNYTVTTKMQISLEELETRRWLIDNVLLMPRHEAWIRRELQVKRAVGTTRIEGANLDEEAVRNLVGVGTAAKVTDDELANINALEAYEFIDFLSGQPDIPIDELVIRQLNRYFMAGSAETLTPGVYRKGQNTVGAFASPDQGDVPAMMRSFALWLREDNDIHPVLKAGISHLHLVAVHPFWDGNGRTARGLSTLILQRSAFGFQKLLSLESSLFGIQHSYFAALEQALGNAFTMPYDSTSWLEFFIEEIKWNVESLLKDLTGWQKAMREIQQIFTKKGWQQRQADAFTFALQVGKISRSEYIQITGVSPVTASRDLAALVQGGVFAAEGKTRRRIYRPVPLNTEAEDGIPEEQLHLIAEK
ncbi:MAG: hypothetical protein BZY88_06940 [SAR202 cluster bacterium Io17-Chloro-G9]|nr:MAG: hypothetical protein BZY88_06940 [SAR202 cluster bacterium Io17-Chloro-G9]